MRRKNRIKAGIILAVLSASVCVNAEQTHKENETVLTGLIFSSHSESYGVWTGSGAEKLSQEKNIRLEFFPKKSGAKLEQYMAAGTLPDFMVIDKSQISLLTNTSLLLCLDDYSEQLSSVLENPVYEKALSYCRENFGGEEEELYLLPLEVGKEADGEFEWLPMLQWNVYQQAGCQKLEDLLDYLDVVEEMQHYKSTIPTGERVYGFSLYGEQDDCIITETAALSYLYGIDIGSLSPLIEMEGSSKEIRSVLSDEGFYKKALEFYFEANQRGLLDPDSRTQTSDGFKQKYDKGRILFANSSSIVKDYNEGDAFQATNYVPIPAADMKIYRKQDSSWGTGRYIGISQNTANPEQASEFLDWLYQEETISYFYENPPAMEPFDLLGMSQNLAGTDESVCFYREATEEGFAENITIEEYLLEQDMVQEGTSAVYMLPVEPTEIQKITKEIGAVVQKLSWDMIYAQDRTSFERVWEQMKEEGYRLGMEKLEQYYQSVWAEALEKEKIYGEIS